MPLRCRAEKAGIGKLRVESIGQIADNDTDLLGESAILEKRDSRPQGMDRESGDDVSDGIVAEIDIFLIAVKPHMVFHPEKVFRECISGIEVEP